MFPSTGSGQASVEAIPDPGEDCFATVLRLRDEEHVPPLWTMGSTLPTDLVHHAIEGDEAFGEAMTPRLFPHAVEDDLSQFVERGARAERGEQIHFFFAEQAQAQASVCGETGARAGRAKRRGDGGDEAYVSLRAGEMINARFAIQFASVGGFHIAKRILDAFLDLFGGDDLSRLDVRHTREGHHLDEAHLPGTVEGEAGESHHIVFVVAAHDYRVEFDGRESRFLGGEDALPDIFESAPARQAVEFLGVEGVYRDVDPVESRVSQWLRQFGQKHAIRRERDRADALGVGDAAHEIHDVRADGRFAARQTDLVEAEAREQAREQKHLVVLHEFRVRAEGLVFGHAIDTAQVAVVGEADAEIVNVASETVNSHGSDYIQFDAPGNSKIPCPILPRFKD